MSVSKHAGFPILLSVTLWSATWSPRAPAQDQPPPPPQASAGPQGELLSSYMQQSPSQLQQLVAPIALYPDSLTAQILAAATFPEQVVEADRWIHANPGLQGPALGQAADQQPWDASVKALVAFPAVLGNMDKNLSWTSSLGDAYYNQPQDVMDAVQAMRQRAQQAGSLKTTPAAGGHGPGLDDQHRSDQCRHCLCPAVRPVAGLRRSDTGMARMVSLPGNLV